MQRLLTWILVAVASLFGALNLDTLAASAPVKGVIRVKLSPETAGEVGNQPRVSKKGRLSTGTSRLDAAAKSVNAVSIRPMLPYSEKFAEQRAKYGLDRWYVVSFDESVSSIEARKLFAAAEGVERSEVITPMVLKEGNGGFRIANPKAIAKAAAGMPFNDPMLANQWHYNNDGSIPYSVAGADINLFEAWKTATGSPEVIVAIIDGGVDYTHEDLAPNLYVNEAELNGEPGVDDDGNGYVDDVYGYNFCTLSGEIYPHSHGTHVAGTVGAVNNNGIGVAGVAGGDGSASSGIRMLSCQVFDSRSGTGDADFAAALVYAAEMGATIAQCSWGWEGAGYYEQPVLDAIDYFTNTARSDKMTGGLCIFAGGNSGLTGDFYPAAYDKVVAVAAMTSELAPASYSNNGPWVDVTAPGGLLDYGELQGVLSTLPGNKYGYNEGTSMATPHVSGIAALILSKYGSPTFTNESLRTQLVTSVNDFYGYGNNAKYEGYFGSGYIDAGKALRMGDTKAPQPVTDLELLAAQDNITVSWIIPASSDDNVNNHIIYWSEKPFSATSDLSGIQSTVVDTKFLSSGDRCTYEITGLKSMTPYYVAVMAVNRWGNAAPLSEVKSATTNAGPKMTVSAQNLSMTAAPGQPGAASFLIGNDAEGLLKWQIAGRTVSVSPMSVTRPMIGKVAEYSGKLAYSNIVPMAAASATPEYVAEDYPKDIIYWNEHSANIGETDKTLPVSMAQWFRVDASQYPEGFNLTHVNITGAGGSNPTIEIYKGDANISQASLVQRINYSFFVYGYNIALNEQLYFAPGESFWIVVHFEPGQEGYPLGMAFANRSDIATYSYMSTDKGAVWTQLAAALKGSPYEARAAEYTWAVTARSLNPDWSSFLDIEPASGQVKQGETMEVAVKADAARLVNGTYRFNLGFDTNETEVAVKSIPVSLSVQGNMPSVKVPKVVDFGSLLVGQSKTLTVEVFNAGYGSFRGSQYGAGLYSNNISCSSENFSGPAYVSSGFPARTKVTFELTYTPTSAGSHNGVVTFRDYQGNETRVLLQGVATEPAKLVIEPTLIDAGTLNVGDTPVVKQFTISNAGKYPLEYVFPKFSSETIDGQTGKLHKFGYSVFANIPGYDTFEYDNNPELIGATDIASSFSDDVYVSDAINIGFSFPYYGKNYSQVYVTTFGGLMFAPNQETFRTPLTPGSYGVKGTGLISAYGSHLMMGPSSKVEYARNNGKFTVAFRNVLASVYDKDYIPVSFHISLSSNGDIEIFYDDYMPEAVFQSGAPLFLGINDPDLEDVITVTSSDMSDYWGSQTPTPENTRFREIRSGTSVKFEAPKASFVRSLSAPYGLVSPGESVTVDAVLSADSDMNAGETFNNLTVISNDPAPETSVIRFNAVIAGDELVAVPVLENETVDFGKVFRTSDSRVAVTVTNAGHDAMTISSASLEGSALSIVTELPVEVPAGFSRDIVLAISTDKEGAVSDRLTVTTSEGSLTAEISGEVIGCPEITLGFSSVEETVASGTPLSKELEVSNPGNEPLVYSFDPADNVSVIMPDRADSKTSYVYSSTVDGGSKPEWIDIETTGLGIQNSAQYYMNHDYVTVELPFEFPFYGKKYSKMYIYNTGFVSFTERHDDKIWPEPPAEFPQGSIFTNIIAPYWGLHTMDITPTAGTYHYVTDDRAVVSFMEYGNSMNIGVCFQLVMEKDGSFRFQYKAANEYATIFAPFGLAGIANADGSESIRLAERQIEFDNAVAFSPVTENIVPPGEKDMVTLSFNTDRMAGLYESVVKLNSNVPASPSVEIPVTLAITGEAKPVFPEDLTVENTLCFRSTDYSNPLVQLGACYDAAFEVRNEGTANMTIAAIQLDVPMIEDPYFPGFAFPAFSLMHYAEGIDWITGEPSGMFQWSEYYGSPVTVGRTPAKFSIPMMEGEYWMTPGTYEIPITFLYYLGDDSENMLQKDFKVTFVVTPAPAMDLSKEEIRITNAADDHNSTETLTISNSGEYKLSYSLSIDPSGIGEEPEDIGGGGIAPWSETLGAEMKTLLASSLSEIKPFAMSTNYYDMPQDMALNNALFHPASTVSNTVYNYGANTTYDVFKAATAFKAPEEGFNMSYIYTAIVCEGLRNTEVSFEVIQGADPAGEVVLGRGSINIASQGQERFYIVPLDKPIYLNPGEEFCVVATYPQGLRLPAYLCVKDEQVVTGRYMAWTAQAGWYDVAELFKDSYGSLGYILSCIETEPGEPWVKLLSEKTEGELAPGESMDVNILVNAVAARMEKGNKAMLVIKSNDPARPLHNFPIYLDMNGAPVIERVSKAVSVKEGESVMVTFSVSEPDLDDFIITVDEPLGLVSLEDVKAAEGDSADIKKAEAESADVQPVFSVTGATLPVAVTVALRPDFGDAGENLAFTLSATDVSGHNSKETVRYDVVKVNRAPVAVDDAETVEVGLGMVSNPVNFSDYVVDPDGDELSYEFSLSGLAAQRVDAYTTSAGVVFFGKKLGKITGTLTATDPDGLSASVPMAIEVKELSGVTDIEGDGNGLVTIADRIFDGILNITSNFTGHARFEVFDAAGASVYGCDSDVYAAGSLSLNLGDVPTGVYLLRVSAGDKSETYRLYRK